jgi:hypothetical protein
MTLNAHDAQTVADFFKATEPFLGGYGHSIFSYVSAKRDECFEICQGQLRLQGAPFTTRIGQFESANIKAGCFALQGAALTVRGVIDGLLSGKLITPHGDLVFPAEKERAHRVYFSPCQDGNESQTRHMQFNIYGRTRGNLMNRPQLHWELRGASTPYDGIHDLCNEFAVGPLSGDNIAVEVLAYNIVAVLPSSVVQQEKAYLGLVLAAGLDKDRSSLGYRILAGNAVPRRGMISGKEMTWKPIQHGAQCGTIEIEVPAGAVIHCFANFCGYAQHHFWVADPNCASNPLRAAHQTFDGNLEVLRELLGKAYVKGQNAREFEVAISRLLWILGFAVNHLGGTAKTTDGPDLIATTPRGDFMVIECTTGLLKADNKLPLLIQRTGNLQRALISSGHTNVKVLPVIVTTKTRDEVRADLDQAQKLGVLVATRETFVELLDRSIMFPNANGLYAEAEEALRKIQTPSLIDPSING